MTTLARPTDEAVSHFVRGFKPGAGSAGHRGLDYGWKTHDDIEVKAAADGVVSFMQYGFPDNGDGGGDGWGNYVKVNHGHGIETGYAHLKRGSIIVNSGDKVKAGQVIALMGNSGSSGGRHLHFELWLNGTRVDPEPYRTRDLPGLAAPAGSTPALSDMQRVFSAYTFRREAPSASAAKIIVDGKDGVDAGEVGNFTHWTHGENVNGSDIWLKGVSGGWFHSSGLKDGTNTRGLQEVLPAGANIAPYQRIVRSATLNERREPTTQSELLRTFKAGEVLDFKAWARGQVATIEGVTSDIWVQGRYAGTWFNLAGFTSQSVEGLEEYKAPSTPTPTPTTPTLPTTPANPDNPKGLPTRTPTYPGAAFALVAPLGVNSSRRTKGVPPEPVPSVGIDRFIVHHTATTQDQLAYFSESNDRGSCPTWYIRADGQVIELIEPAAKPAASGSGWNYRSVAVETLNTTGAPEWKVADVQVEAIAQAIAWLASLDGKDLGGIPVRFKIDREHVISHRETGFATECPGPTLQGMLDTLVARARTIYAEKYAPAPSEPQEPQPEPETATGIIAAIQALLGRLAALLGRK